MASDAAAAAAEMLPANSSPPATAGSTLGSAGALTAVLDVTQPLPSAGTLGGTVKSQPQSPASASASVRPAPSQPQSPAANKKTPAPGGAMSQTLPALSRASSDPGLIHKDDFEDIVLGPSPGKQRRRRTDVGWNGRVAGLNLQQYRELKWGADGWKSQSKMSSRPSYTMRPACTFGASKPTTDTFVRGNIHDSFFAVRGGAPSYSMGRYPNAGFDLRSPGPCMKPPSIMDPVGHPTMKKSVGSRFSTGGILHADVPTPGPGQYDHMSELKNSKAVRYPEHIIQGREAWYEAKPDLGPAVGAYDVGGMQTAMKNGMDTPVRYSCRIKGEELAVPVGERKYILPGPAHYNPPGAGFSARNEHVTRDKAPVWKFARCARGLVAE